MILLWTIPACGSRHGGTIRSGGSSQGDPATAPMHVVSPYAAVSFLEAEMAMAQGDAHTAVKALKMALTSEPDDPLIRARLAAAYLALGRTEEAVTLCQQVLQDHPDHCPTMILMGDIEMAAGRPELAHDWYQQALEEDPDSWEPYERLIGLYQHAGDLESALDTATGLVEAQPTSHEAFLMASDLALELGLTDLAYQYLSRHFELVPVQWFKQERYSSLLVLARRLVEQGETTRALFLVNTYLSLFPDDGEGLGILASTLISAGRTFEARETLQHMGDPGPDAPASAVVELVWLWLQAGDPERALAVLEGRFEHLAPPTPPSAREAWIHTLCRLARFDEAQDGLDTFQPDERSFMLASRAALASALLQAGLPVRAWEVMTRVTQDIPALLQFHPVREGLVSLLVSSSPQDDLVQDVRLACTTSPQGRLVLLRASFLGAGEQDGAQLSADLAELIQEAPSDDLRVDAMVLHATCLIEGVCKANPNKILSLTARMQKIAPADPRLWGLRGMFYLATGNSDRALVSLRQAQVLLPSDPLVKLWLARVLISRGEGPRAGQVLIKALTLAPPPRIREGILATLATLP